MSTDTRWREVEAELRDLSYRRMDSDPESLLEHDSGGPSVKADVIMARLVGLDDEIVRDGWRLTHVAPELRLPIMRRSPMFEEIQSLPDVNLPTARYVLQNGFVLHHLDERYAPPGVEVGPPTFTFTVLYLRYRRRL